MVNLDAYGIVFVVFKPRWLTASFLLCFVGANLVRSDDDDHGRVPLPLYGPEVNHQYRMSCMMLTFVKSKGCDYVRAFVKSHYYGHHHHDDVDSHHHDAPTRSCDWEPLVERKCAEYHVPSELCCALIDCGISQSLDALNIPASDLGTCQHNMTAFVFGKRASRLCDQALPGNYMCQFGKRNIELGQTETLITSDSVELPQINMQTERSNTSALPNSITRPAAGAMATQSRLPKSNRQESLTRRKHVRKWCKVFSRNIKKKYHLNEAKFVRRSAYWVVDIYRAASRHKVPKPYTHGLVGCGMQYALLAFNVEKWQTVLYNLAPQ